MTDELARSDDPFAVDLTPSGLRSRSASGSISVGLSQLLRAVLQLGVTVVLARLLFPDDYGLVAMVYPVVGFIQLFSNLGVGEVVVQRKTLAHEQVSSLFWLTMWVSVALTAVIAVAAPFTSLAYGEPRVTLLMIVIGATLPLSSVGIVPTALLLRQMRFNVIATTELVSGSLGAGATVVAAVAGLGYWALVIGQVTSATAQSLLLWSQVRWRPLGPRRSRRVRGDLSFGANLTGAQFATFLTTSGDNAIVGIVNGKTALGLYDRSYRLVVQPLGQAMAPISRVSIPLLSRLHGDDVEYRRTFLMMLRMVLLLSVPPMVLSIVHSRQVVLLLLGSRWADSAPIFAWVSVGGLVSGLYASMGWLFISQSRSREWLHYSFMAAALSVGSFAIGSHWGVLGVAVANGLVFALLTTPAVLLGAGRHGPVRRHDVLSACLPYVAASLVAAGLGMALPDLRTGRFLTLCAVGVVTYVPFAVLAFSSATERLVFAGLVRTSAENGDRPVSSESPSYTIVMPVYERVAGFGEALDSARAVEACSEILVIDDCSSHDDFERICSSAADPRIRYLRNPSNLGIFGNWNRGVSKARGDFVSILCSDDLISPHAYDLLQSTLSQDPDLDLVFGPFCTFQKSASDATLVRRFAPGRVDPAEFLAEVARDGPGFPVLTIGRRSSMTVRPFVASPHSGNDWWWIYSHASDLRMVATQEAFSFWRRHGDQDASKRQSITTDCWPLMYVSIAHQLHRMGRHTDARRCSRRAVGLIQSWILNDADGTGYRARLAMVGVEQNLFLAHASTLIQSHRVLQGLLYGRGSAGAYRLVARCLRKSGWYPGA